MTEAAGPYRLYSDLASWWPLISPPQEYAAEARSLARVLADADAGPGPGRRTAVREVLDLGSGGGHIARHLSLAAGLTLTLVDLSPEMLEVSRQLNPGLEHVPGDMRTIRLGRRFDAVLLHDAVDYITTAADLRLVAETAFAHCRPGGIALFVPDYLKDDFKPEHAGGGGSDGAGHRASFQVVTSDPDPADDWILAEYEFTLVGPDGAEQVVTEAHRLGAFSRATWLRVVSEAGFDAEWRKPARRGGPANLLFGRRPDEALIS